MSSLEILSLALKHGSSGETLGIAIFLAFAYGCFHVVGPGHGKSVIVAYFLSHEAKVHHGIWLGVRIAATHIASAVVITVFLALVFRNSSVSLEDSRIIRLTIYGAIVLLGCFLLSGALGSQHDHDCFSAHEKNHRHTFASNAVACIAGAIPCTGSLLVLTLAVANGTYLVGTLLLLAIGVGMATTMGAIGLLTITARRHFTLKHLHEDAREKLSHTLAIAGPVLIISVGTILFIATLQASARN